MMFKSFIGKQIVIVKINFLFVLLPLILLLMSTNSLGQTNTY